MEVLGSFRFILKKVLKKTFLKRATIRLELENILNIISSRENKTSENELSFAS